MGIKRLWFHSLIKAKSGINREHGVVFTAHRNGHFSRYRHFTYPRLSEHHGKMGSLAKVTAVIWSTVSDNFKADLKDYAHFYNLQYRTLDQLLISSYNIFIKAVFKAYHKTNESPDCITTLGTLMGLNVSEWINNGHLPKVNTTRPFNAGLEG
jgi:hypothetical protein